ncbi:Hsp20/alpha crystallin family protein [Pontiella sulfatireligans]|uniref:Spore protein SP21 n=1 Tax=Pontiella sulfatireligans TaxID=2750658 RepID=A0A6C2UJ28_9BACT|nr:Hsp20/alpha crystallin family protein [Pontiella sulfatireligans]VGO20225.1 Spore protein SP21 [Pontiella sulfatireligans]
MKDHKDKALEKVERSDAELTRDAKVFVPATDIYEKEDAILVRCDMPGVAQDQVDIRLDNTELEITGTQSAAKPGGVDLLAGEYETGVFRRKFNVPQLIDRDKIKARLRNGVLDIELPKAEQAKPRKIEIEAGGN